MAHNLYNNEQTGQHSFFSVKVPAWHGLGKIVEDYPTSAEAIVYAGLDYEVIKRPNHHVLDDGNVIVSDNSFFNYRADTGAILGDRIGPDYTVVQNKDAFTFFDSIVGGDGILYETAGALGKGERIFITAKLPGYIRVGDDDLTEKYIFLTTSHDGTGSITAAFTPIRIVCANTLAAALQNMKNTIKIRHTQTAKERLSSAHKIMGIANNLSVQMEEIFNQWSKVKITDTELRKLIQMAMVPNKEVLQNLRSGADDELSTLFKNSCESVFQYSQTDETQLMDTTAGTVFGAYNCITGYYNNVQHYKNAEAKMNSILLGGIAQDRTQRAFSLCGEFVQRGADAFRLN